MESSIMGTAVNTSNTKIKTVCIYFHLEIGIKVVAQE